jgi:hypothetical protein
VAAQTGVIRMQREIRRGATGQSKHSRRLQRNAWRALSASGLVALAVWGCSSSSGEKLRAAELAGSCSINSDCKHPWICAFAHCHVACRDDDDCDPGLRCVKGDALVPGGKQELVCQLPTELECDSDKDCPGNQVCGIDDECRDECESTADCTPTQICAKSHECASTLPDHDEVDANGNIVVNGAGGDGGMSGSTSGTGGKGGSGKGGSSGSGGKGGSSASGGTGGTDAPGAGEGGDAGSSGGTGGGSQGGSSGRSQAGGGGSAPSGNGGMLGGGTAGVGAAGSGGTPPGGGGSGGESGEAGAAGVGGGGAGGSAGAATVGDFIETADGIETVNNNDRDHALPATPTVTLHLDKVTEDWAEVTVPDDGRAHVITVSYELDIDTSARVYVYGRADNTQIAYYTFETGSSGAFWVTAGSGATTQFNFGAYESPHFGEAVLTFSEVAENDAQEPNNTQTSPAVIALDTPVYAQMLNPYISAADRPSADFYALDLDAPGTATLSLLSVPTEGLFRVRIYYPNGSNSILALPSEGSTGSPYPFNVTTTGRYLLLFEPNTDFFTAARTVQPTYMTSQYSFQVTRP